MSLHSKTIEYTCNNQRHLAYMVWSDAHQEAAPRPAVLVAHTWAGCGEFEKEKARLLAEQGYVGFAIDMYGNGKVGSNVEENSALMQTLLDNRAELLNRILSAVDACKMQPQVDANKIAAIGFCFGGLCVLDLARSGAKIAGVVSFHGLFTPTGNKNAEKIHASVLALHGYNDPMAKPDAVLALANELSQGSADWQIHAYGNTVHSFTNPSANMPEMGTAYNSLSNKRAFQSALNFLAEKLTTN